jgi:hypothetical protein
MVYTILLMAVLTGFCSLAVDFGRVEVVKTELRRTADAAARAAVANISSGITAAQNAAIAVAALNTADGSAVTITAADIDFGTWTASTKTFTVLTGNARTSANALRVTCNRTAANGNAVPLLFAPLIGKSSADVSASTIAYGTTPATTTSGAGFVGLSTFTSSSITTDSYDASAGSYASQSHGTKGSVTSNSDLTLWSSTINGNANPGKSHSIQGGSITGTSKPLTSAVSYASMSFPSSNNNSNIAPTINSGTGSWDGSNLSTYNGGITLPGGTYVFSNMYISGPIVFTGPAKLYVTNQCNVNGNGYLGTYQSKPTNLLIVCNGSLNFYETPQPYYADIFSPNATLNMSPGNSQFYGSIIVNTWYVYTMSLHYDTSLPDHSPSGGGFTSSSGSTSSTISIVN